MYKCDICGRKIHKKNRLLGHTVCSKHMHQLFQYGHVLDSNPRTVQDLNEFRIISGGRAEFCVYDSRSEINGRFTIDAEDVRIIRWHKWRIDTNGRIITGNCTNKNPRRELSRFILGVTDPDVVVDHIDGDPLNNTRANLRICTQAENSFNKSFMSTNTSGIIGVSWDKARERWAPEIRAGMTRCHLGRYSSFENAVFARYTAEKLLFQEYQNETQAQKEEAIIQAVSDDDRSRICSFVREKLQRKGMIESGYQLCGSP